MLRLDGIGEPELREMLLYVRASDAPVSADDAAVALRVHRSVARGRLERLLRVGLVDTTFQRRTDRTGPGAGRPAKLYSAAAELEALEFPPRHFPVLVARLLDEVPALGRELALRRAGQDFGRQLARAAHLRARAQAKDGLEAICAAVRSLGFQATLDRFDSDTAVIRTPTCPLRPIVLERPEAAHLDRGMWSGLVELGVRDVVADDVECETRSCLDGGTCSVAIALRRA